MEMEMEIEESATDFDPLANWLVQFNSVILGNGDFSDSQEITDDDYDQLLIRVGTFLLGQPPTEEAPIELTLQIFIDKLNSEYPLANIPDGDWVSLAEYLLLYSFTKAQREIIEQCIDLSANKLDDKSMSYLIGRTQTLKEKNFPVVQAPTQKITEESTRGAVRLEFCDTCSEMREKIKSLEKQLQLNQDNYRSDIESMQLTSLKEKNTICDLDMIIHSNANEIFQLKKENEELKVKNHSLQSIESKLSEVSKNYSIAKDELDILQSQTERLKQLETQNAKLHEKILEFSEVKQQLKDETISHSETLNKLLEAEHELQDYRSAKSQNELYVKEVTEKDIEIKDLQYQISTKNQEIVKLSTKLSVYEKSQSEYFQEKNILQDELLETMEELREKSRGNGIGEGLCELNPGLMAEFRRLQNENHELKSKLSSASEENLSKLEKELRDEKFMTKSLNDKWNQTKDALTKANQEISRLNSVRLNLEEQLKQLKAQFSENMIMCEQELTTRAWNHRTYCEAQQMQFSNEMDALNKQSTERMNELTANFSNEIQMNLEQFEKEKTTLNEQIQLIIRDLEDEKVKRRKAERLKELFQSESQRQKLQLSIMNDPNNSSSTGGGSGNNLDFDIAAKELKTMQQSLDTANKEIAQLKSLLDCQSKMTPMSSTTQSTGNNTTTTKSLLQTKPQRVLPQSSGNNHHISTGQSNNNAGHSMFSYLEQSEVTDKRIEQLEREKREILSRSLEDNKEKMELSQKLLFLDKENSSLKNEIRKVVLEKERIERKMLKNNVAEGNENITNTLQSI
jgi:chromosome segregation ATPase